MKLYLIWNTQATSRVRENRIARGMRAGLAMYAGIRSNDDVLSNLKCTRSVSPRPMGYEKFNLSDTSDKDPRK